MRLIRCYKTQYLIAKVRSVGILEESKEVKMHKHNYEALVDSRSREL